MGIGSVRERIIGSRASLRGRNLFCIRGHQRRLTLSSYLAPHFPFSVYSIESIDNRHRSILSLPSRPLWGSSSQFLRFFAQPWSPAAVAISRIVQHLWPSVDQPSSYQVISILPSVSLISSTPRSSAAKTSPRMADPPSTMSMLATSTTLGNLNAAIITSSEMTVSTHKLSYCIP